MCVLDDVKHVHVHNEDSTQSITACKSALINARVYFTRALNGLWEAIEHGVLDLEDELKGLLFFSELYQ
jgi:hypothetical protein